MSPLSASNTISSPVTFLITPFDFASIIIPESFAALYSIPVPTIGESVIISGTA